MLGRPKKEDAKNRGARVAFRISEELRRMVQEEADKRHVSMGDVVTEALEKYFEA